MELHLVIAAVLGLAVVIAAAAAVIVLRGDPLRRRALTDAHLAEFAALVARQRDVALAAIDYAQKRRAEDAVPKLEGTTGLGVHVWYVIRRDGERLVQQLALSRGHGTLETPLAERLTAVACAVLGHPPASGEYHAAAMDGRPSFHATFRLDPSEHEEFAARAPVTDVAQLRQTSATSSITFRTIE